MYLNYSTHNEKGKNGVDDGDEKVERVREGVTDMADLDLLPLCV